MIVFTTQTLALSMRGNQIENVIMSSPVWELGHITPVQVKKSLFGSQSYYIEITPSVRGTKQTIYISDERKAKKVHQTLLEAKQKYRAGYDSSDNCHYRIADVPQVLESYTVTFSLTFLLST